MSDTDLSLFEITAPELDWQEVMQFLVKPALKGTRGSESNVSYHVTRFGPSYYTTVDGDLNTANWDNFDVRDNVTWMWHCSQHNRDVNLCVPDRGMTKQNQPHVQVTNKSSLPSVHDHNTT